MTPGSGSNITYNTNRRCLTCEKSAASLKSYIDAPDATINLFGEQKSYDGFVQVLTKDQNSWPSTLEDFFILTHQSLIAIQQSLFQHYGISKQILEEKDKEIIQEIETILSNIHHLNTNDSHSMVNEIVSIGNTEKLMLLSPEENKIVATFTIPLRSHSGKLSITIPRNVQDLLKLNLRIYGGAENGRWAALEGLTENYIKAHPTIKGFGASSEASFQLQSTFSQDDKNNVLSLVQGVCEISLSDAPISSSNQDLTQHLKQKNTYMEGRCRHVSSGHTRKTLRCRTHRDNCPALSK
jgi:hypothetical protein